MLNVETSKGLTSELQYRAGGSPTSEFAGDCLQPVFMRLAGRPDRVLISIGRETDSARIGYLNARCRKCEMCLRHRSRLWAARAIAELKCSRRTWFGTLTVRPQDRVRLAYETQLKLSRGGTDWLTLSESEWFTELVGTLGLEVTKFWKRVRKNSGVPLRYLMVVEAHKDGFPHLHCLVHESDGPVRKAVLDQAWKLGFTQFRLVHGEGAAWYACKYLSKTALVRIRASEQYGQACYALAAQELLRSVDTMRSEVSVSPPVRREETGWGTRKKGNAMHRF